MKTDSLWFTGARVDVHLSRKDNAAGLSIMEHAMPLGFSPPTHVHHEENETFYVLEGIFRFEKNGIATIARSGDVVHIPAGAVHSFLVMSPIGRFLTITDGGFEDMVRETSRAPMGDGLPELVMPSPEEQRGLAEAGMRNRIELLGPPLAA